jgi:hypothetical protein
MGSSGPVSANPAGLKTMCSPAVPARSGERLLGVMTAPGTPHAHGDPGHEDPDKRKPQCMAVVAQPEERAHGRAPA